MIHNTITTSIITELNSFDSSEYKKKADELLLSNIIEVEKKTGGAISQDEFIELFDSCNGGYIEFLAKYSSRLFELVKSETISDETAADLMGLELAVHDKHLSMIVAFRAKYNTAGFLA
jgi:hypothetical protein